MKTCPVCILAAGFGTRLSPLVRDVPKPLLPVAGDPFLLHQLRLIARSGFPEIVLCVGYLGEVIERRLGDGSRFGVRISYSYSDPEGTGSALRAALPLLGPEFLVLLGDVYLPVDYANVLERFRRSELPALMTVVQTTKRHKHGNAAYADGLVRCYDKYSAEPRFTWVDAGLEAFTADALAGVAEGENDLAVVLKDLAERGQLGGYPAKGPLLHIGTSRGLREADSFLRGAWSTGR